MKGLEVIDAIANTKTVANDKSEKDIKINKITIIANGKDAKNFNAVKVFENYFKDIAKREQEKEAKTKAAAAKFLEEVPKRSAVRRLHWWSVSHMATLAIWAGYFVDFDAVELADVGFNNKHCHIILSVLNRI